MNNDNKVVPLCCCEYLDINNERNHILACFCNCVDLDESFDSLISGKKVSNRNKSRLMATIQDRLRIPWRGGAKQLQFDAILPLIILPSVFFIASLSLWWTIFSFTTLLVFLALLFNFFIKYLPNTKFFFMWSITSTVLLYFIFEFVVIPFLKILWEENVALSVLIFGFVCSTYMLKVRVNQLNRLEVLEDGYTSKEVRLQNCMICQKSIPDKDHHCVWLDCCIGRHNQFLFIVSIAFAIGALLYSSNLTLTSACHPFIFYKTIMLPDDCSEVYQQLELSISFISAIYSLFIAFMLLILFLHQVLLVSIGVSTKEWRTFSLCSKLTLGLFEKRSNSRGFFKNWSRVICWTRDHYSLLNRT